MVLTDIATGWTGSVPVRTRESGLVIAAIRESLTLIVAAHPESMRIWLACRKDRVRAACRWWDWSIGQHLLIISLVKVAWAAKIGVLADGRRFGGVPGGFVGFDEGADAFAVQAADLTSTGRNGFGPRRVDRLVELENAEACSESLFRMRRRGRRSGHA
ncbi:hypothetical protein [Mesorhizobium sp. P13.3]|uniref:hypothetical protein n=1 Tax=Mesorhizobium sp. P13.3 TaxID=2976703 RepID=UPI0038621CFA